MEQSNFPLLRGRMRKGKSQSYQMMLLCLYFPSVVFIPCQLSPVFDPLLDLSLAQLLSSLLLTASCCLCLSRRSRSLSFFLLLVVLEMWSFILHEQEGQEYKWRLAAGTGARDQHLLQASCATLELYTKFLLCFCWNFYNVALVDVESVSSQPAC